MGGTSNEFGYGRLNAHVAVQMALPAITGPDLLCTSGTYSITNLPTGATVTGWSASPAGAVTLSGSGNSRTVTRAGNFSGAVTLTVSVTTSSCGSFNVQREIWAGVPLPPQIVDEDGTPLFLLNLCTMEYFTVKVEEDERQGVLEWEWGKDGDFSLIDFPPTRKHILGLVPENGRIDVRARNACGWSSPSVGLYVFITDCSALKEGALVWQVYPNPADESLTVSAVEVGTTVAKSAVTFGVTLYDGTGRTRLAGEGRDGSMVLDTGGLPEGTYFLHINHGDDIEKQQIVIKHR